MTNSIDSNRAVAAGMLAGGAIGATAGAINAPNALGKIDVDRAFTHTPYTDIVRDRIAKLGEAGRDLFEKNRDNYFNEMDKIDNYVINIIHEENGTITGKELKELVAQWDKSAKSNYAFRTVETAANEFREAIMNLDDEKVFIRSELQDFMAENSKKLKDAKNAVRDYLSSLPKQKGKYAAIIGTVCALAAGALAYILAPTNNNKKA